MIDVVELEFVLGSIRYMLAAAGVCDGAVAGGLDHNAALAQILADGTYKAINDKYFDFDVSGSQ